VKRVPLGAALALALFPALLVASAPHLAAPFEQVSLFALAWLVALAATSAPRGTAEGESGPDDGEFRRGRALAFGAFRGVWVFAPALALGGALDLAAGAPREALLRAVPVAVALLGATGFASEAARQRGAVAYGMHALVWFVVCAGAPLLLASLAWAGQPFTAAFAAGEPVRAALAWMAELSPAMLALAWASAGGLLDGTVANPWSAWGGAALLVAAACGRRTGHLVSPGSSGSPGASAPARLSLVLLALVGLSAAARGENRLWWVGLDLEGPLAGVWLEPARGGRTFVDAPLAAGERLELEVPVPFLSALDLEYLGMPVVLVEGAGSARVFAVEDARAQGDGWRRLPRGLVARARPAPERRRAAPAGAALVIVVGLAAAAVAAGVRPRARVTAALALVHLGAAAALIGPLAPAAKDGGRVVAVELLGSGPGVEVRAERGQLEAPVGVVLALEVDPEGVAVEFAARPSLGDPRAHWVARAAPGARAPRFAAWTAGAPDPGGAGGSLAPAFNGFESLRRQDRGRPLSSWHGVGPWALGDAAPSTIPFHGVGDTRRGSPQLPSGFPGWLLAGLPQGVGVLVADLEPEADGTPRFLRALPFP